MVYKQTFLIWGGCLFFIYIFINLELHFLHFYVNIY